MPSTREVAGQHERLTNRLMTVGNKGRALAYVLIDLKKCVRTRITISRSRLVSTTPPTSSRAVWRSCRKPMHFRGKSTRPCQRRSEADAWRGIVASHNPLHRTLSPVRIRLTSLIRSRKFGRTRRESAWLLSIQRSPSEPRRRRGTPTNSQAKDRPRRRNRPFGQFFRTLESGSGIERCQQPTEGARDGFLIRAISQVPRTEGSRIATASRYALCAAESQRAKA